MSEWSPGQPNLPKPPLFPSMQGALLPLGQPDIEKAWLLETDVNGRPLYWGGALWSFDANDAVRFVRQEDAERTLVYVLQDYPLTVPSLLRTEAIEHLFMGKLEAGK